MIAAILAEGRTSSVRQQVAVSKYASLVVASGCFVAVTYVDTRDNPSDVPSRWYDEPRPQKNPSADKRELAAL